MKRHQSRLAPTVLTLSLLSAASLLTACGGGGGGGAADAAPAAPSTPSEPAKPPEPVLTDYSSPDEPYAVAESSVKVLGKAPVYRLNVIDGRTQKALNGGTFESATPYTGKWITIQKSTVTKQDVKVTTKDAGGNTVETVVGSYYVDKLLGNGTLIFIRDNKLVEVDLTRNSDSVLTQYPLATGVTACAIKGSHLIKRDGSEAAVFVVTAGPDGKCGDAASADPVVKAEASDNVVRIVKTGATTASAKASTEARAPLATAAQIVNFIYQNGALTGVLAQQGSGESTQLAVLSPTLSEVLNTTPITFNIPAEPSPTTITTYETSAANPKLGVQWIADAPGEVGEGYLRLQQFDASAEAYTNYMFTFKWNAETKVASTSAAPIMGLTPGANTNRGANDHKYVYFADGDLVYYGPTGIADEPFRALTLISKITPKKASSKVYISHQSENYLVVRSEGDWDAAYAVNKNPEATTASLVTLFENVAPKKPQTPVGMWHKVTTTGGVETRTPYLITRQRSEYDDLDPGSYSLKRTALSTGEELGEWIDGVNRINILSHVWSQQSIYGQRELLSAIVCPRTPGSKGDCATNGDEMKTVNFANKSFGLLLGKMSTSGTITATSATDVYQGVNGSLNITRMLRGGLDYYEDPWFFNTLFASSLKLVTTPYKP